MIDEFSTPLDIKMDEYNKRFHDGFPTIPLAWGRTDEECIKIIDKCLAAGKNVYDMGYITLDESVKY